MRVEMIEGPIRFVAVRPGANVQTLDLVVAAPGALLDRVPRQGDERICFAIKAIARYLGRAQASLEMLGY